MGDFFEIGVGKPYKIRAEDSEKLLKEKGGIRVVLHAQVRAKEFYEKQGYQPYGEIGFEEGCPHIWMYKIPSEEKD